MALNDRNLWVSPLAVNGARPLSQRRAHGWGAQGRQCSACPMGAEEEQGPALDISLLARPRGGDSLLEEAVGLGRIKWGKVPTGPACWCALAPVMKQHLRGDVNKPATGRTKQ